MQRDETQTRRSLILAALSSSQKETLETGEADEWLFGQKLGDRFKAAKSIVRSGNELKTKSKNTEKSKKTPRTRLDTNPSSPERQAGIRKEVTIGIRAKERTGRVREEVARASEHKTQQNKRKHKFERGK